MLTGAAALLAEPGASAVAALNVVTLEYAEGIVLGAERAGLPVLLSISFNTVRFHGGLRPLGLACLALAERAQVPVGVHLDHCEDADLVAEAADLGFGSAMFDTSQLTYAQNVAATARAAELGRARGLWMEAELGEVGGKNGAHAPGVRTDPAEAAAFVAATGVDGLAVAVGTSHAMTERTATPDLALIAELRDAVPVPLVLHGSSGVGDTALRAAIGAGIRKVNVGTQLSAAYSAALAAGLAARTTPDPRSALTAARESIAETTVALLRLIAAPTERTSA